jgi:5-methylcytosine-specific restriction endonuclease McrA
MENKPREIEKECKTHGICWHVLETNGGRYRCKKCRVVAVQKRRDVLKIKAVEYKGGKCERCGYSKYVGALDFHHVDPSQKDFAIASKGYTRSWEKVINELDKCIMLCSNCHREVHNGIE